MQARLILVDPPAAWREVNLSLPATVGRGREAKVKLVHSQVSRVHCEFFEQDGVLHVRDLGSTNGTFVGDQQVAESSIPPGEMVTIGAVKFKAVYEPEPGVSISPAAFGPTETIRKAAEATFKTESELSPVPARDASPADGAANWPSLPAEPGTQEFESQPLELEPLDHDTGEDSLLPLEASDVSPMSIPFSDAGGAVEPMTPADDEPRPVEWEEFEELDLAPLDDEAAEAVRPPELSSGAQEDDSLHILPPAHALGANDANQPEELRWRVAGASQESESKRESSDAEAEEHLGLPAERTSSKQGTKNEDDDFEEFLKSLE
jgi:FHA domain